MKKQIVFLFLSLIAVICSFSQQTINDPHAEKRSVTSFHGIEVATGIEIILTHGNTEDVAVSASKAEFRDKIITRVENGILKIQYQNKTDVINRRKEAKELKAYVSYKTLDRLTVTSGALVSIQGKLATNRLKMNVNTGGMVKGEISGEEFQVQQGTGSKVTLRGKVERMEISGDTGSKFLGEDLSVNTCEVHVSTGAGVVVSVEKEVNVKANTGGYLKFKGQGGIRDMKTNTGGSVSRI